MAYQPRFTSLVQILEQSTQRFGHKPLFGTRKAEGWEWTSYAEFHKLALRAASALQHMGIGSGDRVAVISNNRLEWAVFAYGTYLLGAAYVPMYEAQSSEDWTFILKDCGAKVCFAATANIRDKVLALRNRAPELQQVVCFDCGSANELLNDAATRPPLSLAPPDEDALSSIIYTSGTTGRPKGVMLTHRIQASNVSACLEVAPFDGEERSVAFLPWAHVFGGALEINALIAYGGAMAICTDTTRLLEYLPEVQPTLLFAVPRIWNRVYDGVLKQVKSKPKAVQVIFERGMQARSKLKNGQPLGKRDRLFLALAERLVFRKIVAKFGGKLRFAISGAAALSPEVAKFVDNLGIMVLEGYGLTETCAGTTVSTPDARRVGAVGRAVPGIELRIDESALGTATGEGEIVVYGHSVMKGYLNNPENTAKVTTEDGGFRTGDLGRIDGDGFLYITGRVKELYKLENGKYVAPAALEDKVQLSPYISQCVIDGANRPYNVALIIPDFPTLRAWAASNGVTGDDEALIADSKIRTLMRAEIDTQSRDFKAFESIRDFILDVPELSTDNNMLTPTMKYKRRNVMAHYGEQLAALYQ